MRRTSMRRGAAAGDSSARAARGHDTRQPTAAAVENEGPEYEWDEIKAERHRSGKVQYKLSWKGYGPKSDSWVGYSQISPKQRVSLFERQRERAKVDSFRRQQEDGRANVGIMQALANQINIQAKKAPSHESVGAFANCLFKGTGRKAGTGCDGFRFKSFIPPKHFLKKARLGFTLACGSDLFDWMNDNGVIISRRDVGQQREARVLVPQFPGTYNKFQVRPARVRAHVWYT
jgi:hypothetical protein